MGTSIIYARSAVSNILFAVARLRCDNPKLTYHKHPHKLRTCTRRFATRGKPAYATPVESDIEDRSPLFKVSMDRLVSTVDDFAQRCDRTLPFRGFRIGRV